MVQSVDCKVNYKLQATNRNVQNSNSTTQKDRLQTANDRPKSSSSKCKLRTPQGAKKKIKTQGMHANSKCTATRKLKSLKLQTTNSNVQNANWKAKNLNSNYKLQAEKT